MVMTPALQPRSKMRFPPRSGRLRCTMNSNFWTPMCLESNGASGHSVDRARMPLPSSACTSHLNLAICSRMKSSDIVSRATTSSLPVPGSP